MSISEKPHIPDSEPINKPKFKLPEGYILGWTETHCADGTKVGWHVLRNSQGDELGLFEFVPGETVEAILTAHLDTENAEDIEEIRKDITILVDGKGNKVGSCVRYEDKTEPTDPRHPNAVLVEYLANLLRGI